MSGVRYSKKCVLIPKNRLKFSTSEIRQIPACDYSKEYLAQGARGDLNGIARRVFAIGKLIPISLMYFSEYIRMRRAKRSNIITLKNQLGLRLSLLLTLCSGVQHNMCACTFGDQFNTPVADFLISAKAEQIDVKIAHRFNVPDI